MMSDKLNEQLSALMDDECATPELALALRRLGKEHELRERWQRYHLISDTLKSNLPDTIRTDFSERIRLEIESESALSPSVSMAWKNHLPLVGWSAAASIALLLGAGFSGLWPGDVPSDSNSVAVLTPTPQTAAGDVSGGLKLASGTVSNASDSTEAPASVTESSASAEEHKPVAWNARLNNYAVSHNSVRGVVPYLYQHQVSLSSSH